MYVYFTFAAHGQWSPWSDWDPMCTVLHQQKTYRRRNCDSPMPVNGGDDCEGNNFEEASCKEVIWTNGTMAVSAITSQHLLDYLKLAFCMICILYAFWLWFFCLCIVPLMFQLFSPLSISFPSLLISILSELCVYVWVSGEREWVVRFGMEGTGYQRLIVAWF